MKIQNSIVAVLVISILIGCLPANFELSDAGLVAAAKTNLAILFEGNDNADSVTQAVTLPTTVASAPGVSITWSSDNPAIDAATGAVTRPANGDGDVTVGLTAAIEKGSESDSKTFTFTVLEEEAAAPTDAALVAKAKADLAIIYGGSDNADSVTQAVTLPTTVATAPGVSITWSSDNPAIDAATGAVTRPANGDGDVTVGLTAAIEKGSESDSKTFTLTVLEEEAAAPTDAALVAKAKADLAIIYGGSDNADSVTQAVTLPSTVATAPGVSITWSSDTPAIDAATGAVSRPSASSSDAVVTLTATISKGTATDAAKTFVLTVIREEPTDIGTLGSFTIDVDDTTAETNTEGSHNAEVNGGLSPGSDYSLAITSPLSITDAGAITIPGIYSSSGAYTITVTATGSGNYSGTKEAAFTLTVLLSDADAVAAAQTALDITAITFASGEDKDSVKQDLTLPTSGDEGTAISWSSDNTAIDAATGAVSRPSASSSDAVVTLTATISKGSVTAAKTFDLTVLKEEPTDIGTLDSFTIDVDDTTAETNTAGSHSVTVNGGLSPGSDYSLAITSPLSITDAGAITIPGSYSSTGSHIITVTATGSGNYSGTKEAAFTLTVLLSDADAVATAQTALDITDITFASGEDKDSVKQDLTLPTSGDEGTAISWSSDNPVIDAATGAVSRPSASSSDVSVTLTATISKGSVTAAKIFDLTVIKAAPTDIGTLGGFSIDVDDTTAETNTEGSHNAEVNGGLSPGSDYSLAITSPLSITDAGAISIPGSYSSIGTHTITVTATGSGNYVGTKEASFTLTVLLSDADAVAAAQTALDIADITFASGEDKDSVKQDLSLPTSGDEGTAISWSSDNTAINAATGAVSRPSASSSDAVVTLTATISKGSATAAKTFDLTVIKAAPTDIGTLGGFSIDVDDTTAETNTESSHNAEVNGGLSPGSDYSLAITSPLSITDAGAITIPGSYSSIGTHTITVTATGSGNYSGTKEAAFTLTVLLSDADAVAAAQTALDITDITFASGEDKDSVKQDLSLPTSGDEGTAISWSSDNTVIDAATGAVSRPSASSSDVVVTLTATITKGAATDTKAFVLTVIKEEPTDIGTLGSFSIDVDDTTAETNTAGSHSVTVNGGLSPGSDYSLAITSPLSITDAGAISIPGNYSSTGSHIITVTATGSGNYSGTKEAVFTLTVLLSDADAVAAAQTALDITDITFASGEDKDNVKQDLTLPTSGDEGTAISWSSDNTAIVAATGAVTRPSASSSDVSVTLTATITKGAATDTKAFVLTVIKEEPTDIGTLGSFTIDVDDTTAETNTAGSHSVTVNGGLSPGSDYTLTITNPLSITDAGAISIPGSYSSTGSHIITVTATGSGNYSGTKEAVFTLTVLLSDADAVAAAQTALDITDITFASGEDKDNVKQDLTLPLSGDEGTAISWNSDNTAIVAATGTVTRPSASSSDVSVTLTATITKGSVTATKTFVLTVIKEEPTDIGTLGSFTIDVDDTTAETNTAGSHSVTVNGGLSPGSDYTLTITNPLSITDAGAISIPGSYSSTGSHIITVTATGSGNYSGTKEAIFTLTVLLSDADAVAAAQTALDITDITFASGEDKDNVKQDLTLPLSGDEGTAISWSSDNTAIVAATGTVTRPSASSGDTAVTLTATITKGSVTATKTFVLTVIKEEPTDIGTLGSFTIDVDDTTAETNTESSHSVTVNGGLSPGSDYSLAITSPLSITNAGAIIIPDSYSSIGTHTITVTATGSGNYSGTKEAIFTLTVLLSDADAVAAAKAALDITDITFASGEDKDSVKQDLSLPTSGDEGTAISWSSDNTAIVAATGTVTRPSASSGDAVVTLTATITKGAATDTKAFVLTVIKEPTDIGTLGSFSIDVDNTTAETNTEGSHSVTVNGGLSPGSDYTLSITSPLSITDAGAITIPGSYTSIGTHTITVTANGSGNYSGTKEAAFTLTVLLSDADAVAAAKAALDITYGGSDNAGSVTQGLTLPTSGDEGTAISWSSDNTAIDAATGTVTRPDASSSDAEVTLTATIAKGTATDTKTFVLTVVKEKTEADMFSYIDAADGEVSLNTELSAHGITVTEGSHSNIVRFFSDEFTDPKAEQASLELALIHFQTDPRNVGGHWRIDDVNNGDGIFLSYTFSTPVSVTSFLLSPRAGDNSMMTRVDPVSIALYDANDAEIERFNNAHTDPNNEWDWVAPTSNYKGYQTTLSTPIEGVHTLKVLIDKDVPFSQAIQFNYFNVGLEF